MTRSIDPLDKGYMRIGPRHESGSGRLLMMSDLHIWGPEDPLYRALLQFLRSTLETGDTLFIVGDLFDVFIGNHRVFQRKYNELLKTMTEVSEQKSVKIFYLEGNHDFFLSGVFSHCRNVHVLRGDLVYKWHGRKILFTHGDRINPHDYGYKVFRAVTQNPLSRFFIEMAPGTWVDVVGRKLSHTSRYYNPTASDETVTMFRNFACDQVKKGYDFVVMGHSHYLDDIRFQVGDRQGQYVNNGFPRRDARYLELNPGDKTISLREWEGYISPLKGTLPER